MNPFCSFPIRLAAVALALSCSLPLSAAVDAARQVRPAGISLPEVGSAVPSHLAVRPPAGTYLPRTVLIKTKERFIVASGSKGFPSLALYQGLEAFNVQSVHTVFTEFNNGKMLTQDTRGIGRIYEITYDAPVDAYDACLELSRNPAIEYAVPAYNRYVDMVPNDPQYSQQYALSKVQADKAWDITKGKPEILIAIVDSGTDYEHEDLAGNLWTNPNEIPDNGKDDDNNGKIDDVHGWDFVGNVSFQQVINGVFLEDNDPKVRVANLSAGDVRGHGTNVAGVAAAVTNNAKGVAGMGFNCRFVPIKCGSDNASAGGIYRGYEAILYAARLGADVINCSWGGFGNSPAEQDVISQVTAMGSLVVAASGNNSLFTDAAPVRHYPSNYLEVLSVGATQQTDATAGFSNYGGRTLIYAPGDALWTTRTDNRYTTASGTSFSAPLVSGIAALVLSVHPNWTPRQVLQQLRSTSDNVITGTTADTRYLFYGRINAYRAVQMNQSFTSGTTVPGVSSIALDVLPDAAETSIRTLDPTPVQIKLKNYLAPASNLQVSVRSLDGFATFPTSSFTLGSVGTLEEKVLDLTVQLSAYTPWSAGSASVLLTYKSGSYEDYEIVSIPVALPNNGNRYQLVRDLLEPVDVQWNTSTTPDFNTFWSVGYLASEGTGYFTNSTFGYPIRFANKPAFAVAARSAQTAWAGLNSANGGQAEIQKTVNGGANWSTVSVSSITSFINALYFFDDNEGLLLGDPAGTAWGVARTTDGGQTWKTVTNLPTPITGESGLVGTTCRVGDNVWFGTTKGRIFYSADRGKSWQVSTVVSGAYITAVSFSSASRGMVVYRMGADVSLPPLVASTQNGGQKWDSNLHNFTSEKLTPVGLYSPENSTQTIVIGSGSEMYASLDHGRTWGPHRTGQMGATTSAAGATSGSKARVWIIGAALAFNESTIPKEKQLAADVSSLAFGSVDIGAFTERTLTVTSTGIQAVTVSSFDIANGTAADGDYTVVGTSLPLVVPAGGQYTITVRFSPSKAGYKTAALKINSDTDVISVNLTGFGTSSVSVRDEESLTGVTYYPNPASEYLTISFPSTLPGTASVELVDLTGTLVLTQSGTQTIGGLTTVTLPVSQLASGVYFYRLRTDNGAVATGIFTVRH